MPADDAGGANVLDDLTDVSTSGVTDGQVIKYDAISGEWLPADDDGGSDNQTLSVGAGTATTSLIQLTGSSNDITLQAGSNVTLSEDGNTITIASTDNDTWQPNTQAQAGYVSAGGANNNMVWKTDGSGNPAWRAGNVNDADADPTNEAQTLAGSGIADIVLSDVSGTGGANVSRSGNTLTIDASGAGDNWGTQVTQTTTRLTGAGTAASPLDIAQQGASSGQVLKWNGTSWVPAADNVNDADSDPNNELITAATYTHASHTLRITEAGTNWDVDLTALDNSGTDNQNLSFSGAASPYTLEISGGDNVTFTAGTGITLNRTSTSNLTIVNSGDTDPIISARVGTTRQTPSPLLTVAEA